VLHTLLNVAKHRRISCCSIKIECVKSDMLLQWLATAVTAFRSSYTLN